MKPAREHFHPERFVLARREPIPIFLALFGDNAVKGDQWLKLGACGMLPLVAVRRGNYVRKTRYVNPVRRRGYFPSVAADVSLAPGALSRGRLHISLLLRRRIRWSLPMNDASQSGGMRRTP